MAASDEEIATMLELLSRDVSCTGAARFRDMPETVADVREWYELMSDADIASLTERVVGDTQQALMDTFVDTSWPPCPRHPNHPLWFRDGAWHCDRDGQALATLGGLKEILPPLPPAGPTMPGAFARRRKAE